MESAVNSGPPLFLLEKIAEHTFFCHSGRQKIAILREDHFRPKHLKIKNIGSFRDSLSINNNTIDLTDINNTIATRRIIRIMQHGTSKLIITHVA